MSKPFSQQIKEYREANHLSREEMAGHLGMSLRMYDYYVKGEFDGNPNRIGKYLKKLAATYTPHTNEAAATEEVNKKYVASLEEQIALQKEVIELLRRENADLKKLIAKR